MEVKNIILSTLHGLTFTTQTWILTILEKKPFENNVRKGENAGN